MADHVHRLLLVILYPDAAVFMHIHPAHLSSKELPMLSPLRKQTASENLVVSELRAGWVMKPYR